ncbi:MAG: HPr family phosphocarrier protein [Victivallales bacterium]|nr:HPr family phosphocarrier protein [Victivallales bacterium]
MGKIESRLVIKNRLGLHFRAATLLAEHASEFKSDIKLRKDGREVDAKSLMGILTLAAGKNSELEIIVVGEDFTIAHEILLDLIVVRKFDEE